MEEQTIQSGEKKKEEPDELAKYQKERDEYLDGWKRAKAELLNYKKDEAKRFETIVKLANEGLVNDLLVVLDSFDLAILALESQARINADSNADKRGLDISENQRGNQHESASWQKGMYLIRSQLEDILKYYGLERIATLMGQVFDPARQESIVEVESDKPAGTVIEELEKGYLLNGRVIRPARVKVAK